MAQQLWENNSMVLSNRLTRLLRSCRVHMIRGIVYRAIYQKIKWIYGKRMSKPHKRYLTNWRESYDWNFKLERDQLTWQKTNALKTKVFLILSACSRLSFCKCRILLPSKLNMRRTAIWYSACNEVRYVKMNTAPIQQGLFQDIKMSRQRDLDKKVSPHNVCHKRFPAQVN
jgi:hypothetical protein